MLDGGGRHLVNLDAAEFEEYFGPGCGHWRLEKGPFEIRAGQVWGAASTRLAGGSPQRVDQPLITAGPRSQQVPSYLVEFRSLVGQAASGALMPALPRRDGQVLINGGAHQRVHETHRGLIVEDPLGRQRLNGVSDGRRMELREGGDPRQGGARTEHGHRTGHGQGRRRHAPQPEQDALGHGAA